MRKLRLPGLCLVAVSGVLTLLSVSQPLMAQTRQGNARGMQQQTASPQMVALRATQQEKLQAFMAEEEAEGKEFMSSQTGKPKAEMLAALKEFKTHQYDKNSAFRQQLQDERLAAFETAFAARPGAKPAMKERALSKFTENYQEIKVFFAGKHQENMNFIDKMSADKVLDGSALNAELQKFFQGQKDSAKAFMDQKKGK